LIGYEWQKAFSNRSTFYFGADAGIGFSKSSNSFDFDGFKPNYSNPIILQQFTSSSTNYLLKPMAGIKFKLNSKLYLGLETGVTLNYSQIRNKNSEITFPENQNEPIFTDNGKTSSKSFNLMYNPVSNIQLIYKF
jgi:hypothetical protein